MLELTDVELKFGAAPLFDSLNLVVHSGEICLLTAPSGAGKSSLLRWVAGLETPGLKASGQIFLKGRNLTDVSAENRHVGLLFQTPLLFPHLSVADNLGFGLPSNLKKDARNTAIQQALERAGLRDLSNRDPQTLSGGQQARLVLLRTLLAEPQALLLDEPFSSLDGDIREAMIRLVRKETRRLRLPVLLVSHDPRDEALPDRPAVRLACQNQYQSP